MYYFNHTDTSEIYTLSLHDALPISYDNGFLVMHAGQEAPLGTHTPGDAITFVNGDWKSTRLNSSHSQISYAVFCLKKKNTTGAGLLRLTIYALLGER